jgi:protein gp37
MGATTGISWTRSTRNFWSGCTKVGPGCDGCYAEASSRRMRGVNEATGQAVNWGPGAARIPHLEGADRDVRKWNELARLERGGHPKARARPGGVFTEGWPRPGFWPVFINSYSDFADNEVPQDWRRLMFTTIEECPDLHFQLVTKRVGNVEGMLEGRWSQGRMPKNVWLIVTAVTQEELDRDGAKLLELTERLSFPVIGLSIEPQLGPVSVRDFLAKANEIEQTCWVICGGESSQPGHPARPFDLLWARTLQKECALEAQPFFFKQMGSRVVAGGVEVPTMGKGDDPARWPYELRVQEFPV